MKSLWEIESDSPETTEALGRRLGQACRGGEVFLLDGPLGAGKTCLARGVARGLGIDGAIVSPTYVLLRSYRSPGGRGLTLHHLDLYRLEGAGDVDSIGIEDCLGGDSVVVAEWPGRSPESFGGATLVLKLEIEGEERRRIAAFGGGLAVSEELTKAGNEEHEREGDGRENP